MNARKTLHLYRCSVGKNPTLNCQAFTQGVIETNFLPPVGELACGTETVDEADEMKIHDTVTSKQTLYQNRCSLQGTDREGPTADKALDQGRTPEAPNTPLDNQGRHIAPFDRNPSYWP